MEKAADDRTGIFRGWLAWERRRRGNKVLFAISVSLAAFVTGAFVWAMFNPVPGDYSRYFLLTWVWGLCIPALLFGMAEWKTSPLRKGRERGRYWVLLYVGALLIVTRALNMFLYHAP
ncbi:MAG: hypothetical protein H0U04_17695 [Rubrobacter sp.]|nr:hypothetical protein [Rubrobacter sp.]